MKAGNRPSINKTVAAGTFSHSSLHRHLDILHAEQAKYDKEHGLAPEKAATAESKAEQSPLLEAARTDASEAVVEMSPNEAKLHREIEALRAAKLRLEQQLIHAVEVAQKAKSKLRKARATVREQDAKLTALEAEPMQPRAKQYLREAENDR
jgi:hypothetical protein